MGVLQSAYDGEYDVAVTKLRTYVEAVSDDKMGLTMLALFSRIVDEDYDTAESALLRVLDLDAEDRYAVNQLVYLYDETGNYDRAIWAINRYIELAPLEHNPRDTRGDLLAKNGRFDEAMESYQEALAIKPDFHVSRMNLGLMFVYVQAWDSAATCFEYVIRNASPFYRASARRLHVALHVFRGQYRRAMSSIDVALRADEMDDQLGWEYVLKWELKGHAQAGLGDPVAALGYFDRGLSRDNSRLVARLRIEGVRVAALIAAGRDEDARRLVATAEARADALDPASTMFRDSMRGRYALETGDYENAVVLLEAATPARLPFPGGYQLAVANLRAGRTGRAVELFQRLLSDYTASRFLNPLEAALLYYYAGQAFEASGWSERAIEQYETLLSIWAGSDPGIPEKDDAEARVARLKAGS
jgi:tetratricopeptide (TPR) repeat protein